MPAAEIEPHRIAMAERAVEGRRPRASSWTWYAAVVVVCAHFGLSYVGRQVYFLDLRLYAEGKLGVPFQYRTLVGWVFRGLASSELFLAIAHHAPGIYKDPYILAYLLTATAAMAGSVFATSDTLRRLTGDADFARWSSLLVVFMGYSTLILMYGLLYTLPYDVPSLFFFCMGINLIVRRKFWLYYLLFIPAVFNRETICFLTIFFAVWEWERLEGSVRSRAMRIVPHVAAQAAIWLGIKIFLFHLYAHNVSEVSPNRVFTDNIHYNLKCLLTPGQWPLLLSLSGFGLPFLVAQGRFIGNRAFARASAVVLPLWLVGMFAVGAIVEVRIFTEMVSMVAPATALIVFHRYYDPRRRLEAATQA